MVDTEKIQSTVSTSSISSHPEAVSVKCSGIVLDSLYRLGIDPLEHDIRFVEDNWEAPTLGAWGLGWKSGLMMEVTQFTYFQQVGGLECQPVR